MIGTMTEDVFSLVVVLRMPRDIYMCLEELPNLINKCRSPSKNKMSYTEREE
uniref:Uncharacterized protein n=1 Tax=Utricularia reniformis TaxID=192314 RepID=A0A1Y0B1Y8_9LAMI|nr:hypothetical protein AEK19_MT1257 [Utricularia reniformis]ART31465.1 hypothetical protein AEK19_MT1257 [Utricularia reniformis]